MAPDLSGLQMKTDIPHPHRRGHKAVLVILLLCLPPLGFIGYKFRHSFVPVPTVPVRPVVIIESTSNEKDIRSDEILFQAAGWIEPEPYAVKVPVLTNGIVKELHVLDGQAVTKGQLLASLIDDDLKFAGDVAAARCKEVEMDIEVARADHKLAEERASHLAAQIATVKAYQKELEYNYEVLRSVRKVVPGKDIEKARLSAETQKVKVREVEDTKRLYDAEVSKAAKRISVMRGALEQAKAQLGIAELALSRTQIHAPMDGIIMRLHSRVGRKHTTAGDNPDSTTLAEMYDPKRLQVRVDVPLQDAGRLSIGQKAKVKLDLFPDKGFAGEVTSIVGIADIQRNTLQAKVRLLEAAPAMRPEMLVRVEFYGNATPSPGKTTIKGNDLFVHQDCLQEVNDRHATVFTVNPLDQKVEVRVIKLGNSKREGWREVVSGVNAGEKVIVGKHPTLHPGRRVQTTEEGSQL